jgi:hypothetical protein
MTALGKLTKKRHAQRNESTQKRLKRVLATTHADFKDTFPFLALPAGTCTIIVIIISC